jgi:hypothetical protein
LPAGQVVVKSVNRLVRTAGFDPVMFLPGWPTFAQLPTDVKNANSHRGRTHAPDAGDDAGALALNSWLDPHPPDTGSAALSDIQHYMRPAR